MKKTNSNFAKILSVILAAALVFACIPTILVQGLTTKNNTQQVEYTGGWNPAKYPVDGTLYKDRVAVSKTIAPTEKENYFDITLKVVAKPRVIDQSVDVVLVMDISNTMNSTHEGLGVNDKGYKVSDARITHAKNAVNSFLDLYATDKNISEDRRFGLVTFNSYANTLIPLTTVNTSQKASEIKTTVNKITAPTGNRERFTNIEGGLQLAHNLLNESDAAFKYIIFITDGFPTTYIESGRNSLTKIVGYDTYMTGSYNASKVGRDGYFADSVAKKLCSYGVNYSDKAADRADDVAAAAKKAGINIFSIGIDVGVQSIPDYISLANKTTHTTVDRTSNKYVIGSTTESYKAWLSNSIAGGPMIEKAESSEGIHRYASGNSATQLNTAFTNILKDIELIPAETMEEAYTLDPMSDSVDFLYFFDVQGKPSAKITNTTNSKDVAVFNKENKTIKWWLTTTQNWYIDEIGNYVLSLTYRVRLKNEAKSFDYNTALKTNKTTTFYFKTVDFATGEALFGDNSIDYLIPEVEGYRANFSFTKQDSVTGHTLEGAEFTLQHYGNSCNVCAGDAIIADKTATSDKNGKVSFANIPSGHEYVLMETKAPEGYQRGAYHSVAVAYGKTYFDGVLVTAHTPAVIKNQTLEPVEVVFTAQKHLEGRELQPGEFSFVLEGVFEHGNVFHEKATNDETGKATFHEIIFDEAGTYNFKIREEKGADSTVVYDSNVYNIEVKVTLSEDGKHYEVETFVNSEKAADSHAPEALEFTNTLREAGYAQLQARKTMNGEIPEDGVFNFELKDERGNVLQTKTSTDGNVIFDELVYANEGVYTYTITEKHPESDVMTDVFFDHSVYTAKVTVTAPSDDGAFETSIEYYKEGEVAELPIFENKTRTPATLKFNAIKTLDGLRPLQGQFEFLLTDSEDNTIARVPNTADGVVEFPVATFDEIGYYTYSVKEVLGTEENIIYDKTIYNINVTVEAHHNLQSYYLDVIIEKPYLGGTVDVARVYGSHLDISTNGFITFENTTLQNVEVELTANKLLNGETPSEDQVFDFVLIDEDNTILQTVSNKGSEITFGALEFSRSGIYRYTIQEVADNNPHITYDPAVYTVTITVTAPTDGSAAYLAQVELSKNNQAVETMEFFNTTVEETTTAPTEPLTTVPTTPTETDPTEPLTTVPTTPTETDPTESLTTVPTTPTEKYPDEFTVPVNTNLTNPGAHGPTPPAETDATGGTEANGDKTTPDIPKTGESGHMLVWAMLMMVCAAGVITIKVKRKSET